MQKLYVARIRLGAFLPKFKPVEMRRMRLPTARFIWLLLLLLSTTSCVIASRLVDDARYEFEKRSSEQLQLVTAHNPNPLNLITNMDKLVVMNNLVHSESGRDFYIIDIDDPEIPITAGSYTSPDYIRDFAILDEFAYLINEDVGIEILSISDPSAIQSVHVHTMRLKQIVSLLTVNQYIYVYEAATSWDTSQRVRILDASQPTRLLEINVIDGMGDPLAWRENILLARSRGVQDGYVTGVLQIIDISNPESPQIVSEVGGFSPIHDVVFADASVHVTASSGIYEVNIATPSAPRIENQRNDVGFGAVALDDKSGVLYTSHLADVRALSTELRNTYKTIALAGYTELDEALEDEGARFGAAVKDLIVIDGYLLAADKGIGLLVFALP